MSEYQAYVGQRVELRQELLRLKAGAASHRDALRLLLNPVEDITGLDVDRLMALSVTLTDDLNQIAAVEAKIDAINKIIGK